MTGELEDDSELDSGDDFKPETSKTDDESVGNVPSPSIHPTVMQGRSKRVRKPTNLAFIHRFWEEA
jgi:hypothetical protein